MINEYNVKKFCSEDISLIENYQAAIADTTQTWHCHHRLEILENKSKQQLIDESKYWHVPANELIFLTPLEHHRLHKKGKQFSKEHCQKISERTKAAMQRPEVQEKLSNANKGENNPNYGKPAWNSGKKLSAKHRQKIINAMKLPKVKQKIRDTLIGTHWYNNGTKCIMAKDPPGPEWKRGRI